MQPSDDLILNTLTTAKHLDALRSKILEKKDGIKNDDLQSFRQFCCHEDINTAILACEMIVDFVRFHDFSLTQAVSFLITSSQSTRFITGLAKGITDLLLLDMRRHTPESYTASSDFLQHPIIVLLNADTENWPIIELQLKLLFDSAKLDRVFNLLKPVFMYGLWSPSQTVTTCCKRELSKYLIDYKDADLEFFLLTLYWLRIEEPDAILDTSYFLCGLMERQDLIDDERFGNIFSLLLADVSCTMAVRGYQPEYCLKLTQKLLQKYPAATDLVLILFARTLCSCPARYLPNFIKACNDLITSNGFSDVTVVWMVIAGLLPYLSHSRFLRDIGSLSDFIFRIAEKNDEKYRQENYLETLANDQFFLRFIQFNRDSYWAFVFMRNLESYSSKDLIQRLSKYPLAADDLDSNHVTRLFLSGILLASGDVEVQKSILNILVKTNAGSQLPLILFMLSKVSCPELQLILTYSLPLTAVNKNNIPPILTTLNALTSSKKPILAQISVQLYLDLWKSEKRCYVHLSEHIQKHKVVSPDTDSEMDVITAQAIREICTLEPTRYGREWVALLSNIMNRCTETCCCLPLVEALTAILKLCEARVVNILTLYNELSGQSIFEDKRPRVIEKLCQLVEMIFVEVRETTVDQHWPTIIRALETMWGLVVSEDRPNQIVVAALRALAKFNVALMPLSVIPPAFRKGLKQSSASEVSLPYVPGYVWIHYLQRVREDIRTEVCRTISSWLQTEASNFGRGFQRSIRGEPQDVSFLHDSSVFKAIVKFLKRLTIKNAPCSADELMVAVSCLVILNDDLVSKLPLFDWTFLEHFLKYADSNKLLKKLVLQFFAEQSGRSVSARKGIENYMKSVEVSADNIEEVETILNVVPKACRTVSPPIFANILTSTMTVVPEQVRAGKNDMYALACVQFARTLEQTDLDEHNRDCVCENILRLWNDVSLSNSKDSKRFVMLVKVVAQMPRTFIEHLVASEELEEMNLERLRRFMKFAYLMCMRTSSVENPFFWLTSCVNIASKCSASDRNLFFLYAKDLLRKHRSHLGKWPWLLQLMDSIYKGMNEETITVEQVHFMCDVLIFAAVIVSHFYPFAKESMSVKEYWEYFPQALNDIVFKDVSSKIMEWLHCMAKSERTSEEHRTVFRNSIIALRYNDYVQKVPIWSRIISVFYHTQRDSTYVFKS